MFLSLTREFSNSLNEYQRVLYFGVLVQSLVQIKFCAREVVVVGSHGSARLHFEHILRDRSSNTYSRSQ